MCFKPFSYGFINIYHFFMVSYHFIQKKRNHCRDSFFGIV